jgi:hypothetical protein
MENTNKFILAIIILFFVAVVIITVIYKENLQLPEKYQESFTVSKSTTNLLLTDNFGNINTYTTNNNSILLTNERGQLKSLPFPKGLITTWYNEKTINPTPDDIPLGWALCDGSKTRGGYQTPDLRDRFILGFGSGQNLKIRNVDEKGGLETVQLEEKHVPPHSHNINDLNGGNNRFGNWGSPEARDRNKYNSYKRTDNTDGGTVGEGGKAVAHENMPPYYVLCYICFTAENLN